LVVPQSPKSPGTITPGIEIAWARAVSRAFDDPAYYRYLKADPKKALEDLGADVSDIDLKSAIGQGGGLTPTLDDLDTVNEELEKKRAALRSAERSTYQTPAGASPSPYVTAWQPMQSGITFYGAPYPTTVHVHVQPFAMSSLPKCVQPTCVQPTCVQPQGYWGPVGVPPGWPCIAMSQVATTRAGAARGVAPPQWIGGPPSGALCSA
jgi:hypothetical protein